jgi:hypothetical protein
MNFVRNELNIPRQVIPLNLIPVGYPVAGEKAKDKYQPQNIYWNKWG